MRRTHLKAVSAKRRKRDAVYPSSRAAVYARADGLCEAAATIRCERDGHQVHHIAGRQGPDPHRLPAIEAGWLPYTVKSPLAHPPYIAKGQMVDHARRAGLEPPAAYEHGFPHANCLDQGCVRGGQAYWELLLRKRPDVYAKTEAEEQEIRQTEWGKDAAMLRSRIGGTSTPVTLTEFRERLEQQPALFDELEWGGCGCFTEEAA